MMLFVFAKIGFLLIWTLVVPAYLLTLIEGKASIDKILKNISLAFLFIPILTYGMAFMTGQLMSFWFVFTTTSFTIGVLIGLWLMRSGSYQLIIPSRRKNILFLSLILLIFIFHLSTFTYPEKNRYNCPDNWAYLNTDKETLYGLHNPASAVPENIRSVAIDDIDAIEFNLTADFPTVMETQAMHYRVEENQGTILANYQLEFANDESFALGIHPSYFLALYGLFGFRLMYSLIFTFSSCVLLLILWTLPLNRILNGLILLLLNFSPLLHIEYEINRNYLSMLIILIILAHLVTSKSRIWYIVSGASYGFLVGLNPITVLMAPAFLIHFWRRWKRALPFLLGVTLLLAPVLAIRYILYENALMYEGFLYYPQFVHSFFGWTFHIPTLLNYPFYGNVVRSPGFAYPTFIYLPLVLIKSLGILLFCAMAWGTRIIRDIRTRLMLIAIPVILVGFLMINENWREGKTTFLVMVLPILLIFAMGGLRTLIMNAGRVRVIVPYLLLVVIVSVGVSALGNVSFEVDERAYITEPGLMAEEAWLRHSEGIHHSNPLYIIPPLKIPPISLHEIKDEIDDPPSPHFLEKFESCMGYGKVFSSYGIEHRKEGTFLKMSKRIQETYNDPIITSIDLRERGIRTIRDVGSPAGCYSFDLKIVNERYTVELFMENITYAPGKKTIGEEVRLIRERPFYLRIHEGKTLIEETYVPLEIAPREK